VVSHVTGTSVI